MFGSIKRIFGNITGNAGVAVSVEPLTKAEQAENYKKGVREAGSRLAIIALGAKLAISDGKINQQEVDNFSRLLSIDYNKEELGFLIEQAANDKARPYHYAQRIISFFPSNKSMFRKIVSSLFDLAAIDGPLNNDEIMFLKDVVDMFDLEEDFLFKNIERHIIPCGNSPYEIISVPRNVTETELKKAYRKAIQIYHPDKISSIFSSRKIISAANRRISLINQAYKTIRSQKRFK